MIEHTPGPWIAAPYSSVVGAPVVASSGRPIATVTYFGLGGEFENHDDESLANGKLIAAAPDMLHALEMIRDADNDCRADGFHTLPYVARLTIDRAIAKAKGEE